MWMHLLASYKFRECQACQKTLWRAKGCPKRMFHWECIPGWLWGTWDEHPPISWPILHCCDAWIEMVLRTTLDSTRSTTLGRPFCLAALIEEPRRGQRRFRKQPTQMDCCSLLDEYVAYWAHDICALTTLCSILIATRLSLDLSGASSIYSIAIYSYYICY